MFAQERAVAAEKQQAVVYRVALGAWIDLVAAHHDVDIVLARGGADAVGVLARREHGGVGTDPGLVVRLPEMGDINRERDRCQRTGGPLAVAVIDFDRFKKVNDLHGHDAGDAVLREVANLLRSSVRGSDVAARYGGEEFTLLLPDATAAVAEERAEKLRRDLQELSIPYGSHALNITASFGVAEHAGNVIDASGLMKCADAAVYGAKEAGRNKGVVDREPGAAGGRGARD